MARIAVVPIWPVHQSQPSTRQSPSSQQPSCNPILHFLLHRLHRTGSRTRSTGGEESWPQAETYVIRPPAAIGWRVSARVYPARNALLSLCSAIIMSRWTDTRQTPWTAAEPVPLTRVINGHPKNPVRGREARHRQGSGHPPVWRLHANSELFAPAWLEALCV